MGLRKSPRLRRRASGLASGPSGSGLRHSQVGVEPEAEGRGMALGMARGCGGTVAPWDSRCEMPPCSPSRRRCRKNNSPATKERARTVRIMLRARAHSSQRVLTLLLPVLASHSPEEKIPSEKRRAYEYLHEKLHLVYTYKIIWKKEKNAYSTLLFLNNFFKWNKIFY